MKRLVLIVFLLSGFSGIVQGQTADRPLILPFQDPPGIDTWLLGQAYGNTTGAYRFGDQWYSAGQGLHFGLDFSAPCGSPLVAVADGTVAFVDNLNFGSAPHNVILRHDALGLTSLYGHLQSRSTLVEGARISQGDFVGYSGDPDSSCDSRPHLHLEIRTLNYRTAVNPVAYMDADWDTLASIGSFSNRNFQMNLDNIRQWQSFEDQPDVAFGGRILNNYSAPYPAEDNPPGNLPLSRTISPVAETNPVSLRLFEASGCCPGQWWHPTDANRLFTMDGFQNQRASIFAYDAGTATLTEVIGSAPPPFYSPDYTLTVSSSRNSIGFVNTVTDDTWSIETDMAIPAINHDNTRLLWVVSGGNSVPGQNAPVNNILISDIQGNDLQLLFSEAGISANWLDANRLILTISDRPFTQVDIFDTRDNSRYTLGRWYRPRGFTVSPGGERIMFYLAYQPGASDNGVYWIEIAPGAVPNRVDWFGSYRWRDAETVFYIPFEPGTGSQRLMLYSTVDNSKRALTDPGIQPFSIMDGQWSVNADGTMIIFRNRADGNLWVMDIARE